ncbi:MAG: hypothetical protein LBN93_04260 [Candidatus Symbiothrix sp.]|nr:hypothetical protein [Candidatus Symbiothrix sp.]
MYKTSEFVKSAKNFTRNPLGIIALFISLLYGLGSITLSSNISYLTTNSERLPVIWFIIAFPLLLLGVFAYLVVCHHAKLYSPSEYSPEMQKLLFNKNPFINFKLDSESKTSENLEKVFEKNLDAFENENNLKTKYNSKNPNDRKYAELAGRIWSKIAGDIDNNMSIEIHSTEYYLFSIEYKQEDRSKYIHIIIHISQLSNGIFNFTAIGKDISSESIEDFSQQVIGYLNLELSKLSR